jgi:beta-1,4-mannosyl-glycoprotein beta-1,4-N-acetylglucosaminyltransferase
MQIIDVVTFNGEMDLLEIRLNVLNEYVDQFIIVEAPTTFSGKPKPLYFEIFLKGVQEGIYNITAEMLEKIKYYVINENYTKKEIKQAKESPNTQGAEHWKHEFLQKESIKKALTHLDDNDLVFIGDMDEIWDKNALDIDRHQKLALRVYSYYLNNRSSEMFWGTLMTYYGNIKNECLNHARTNASCTSNFYGWHFTSMGGYEQVKRKLEDSYTEESYASPDVMNSLETNIEEKKDFLGRPFSYTLDETDLPSYIISNKQRYEHLFA